MVNSISLRGGKQAIFKWADLNGEKVLLLLLRNCTEAADLISAKELAGNRMLNQAREKKIKTLVTELSHPCDQVPNWESQGGDKVGCWHCCSYLPRFLLLTLDGEGRGYTVLTLT